ncbi:Leucine-rich repeat - like 10 [Theobroma cacao]|nr:Leucine-rich repeat - like 10 [Theobroma cacao]
MRADKKIEVTCLPEEKAWQLFEEHVGKDLFDSHPNIRDLAQEVAKECGGLPLALITIGRAMACKTTYEEWKYAIEVLRRSSATSIFQGMGEEVYPLLKYSFDSLSSDMVRSCLLYCSLFSEDFLILKERLIDCWIGEGFLDEHDNISQARNQGHHIIGSLIHACLLEEVDDWYVKMHDVIRDMCLWIACTCEAEKWKFFVQAGYQLTKVPDVGKWRGIKRMSLMDNKIENLREAPNCPDLQTLFLSGNKPLDMIDDDFFQFMCVLKVLDLSRNKGIAEFPMGISKLVSLEYLDLSFTNIRELPIELRALKKLKCLRLQYIDNRIKIPRGLMPDGCSKLRDITWLILAPNLKRLLVLNCDKMEEIINEIKLRQVVELVKTLNRFSNLQYLVLLNLPELKSIYLDALPYSCMKIGKDFEARLCAPSNYLLVILVSNLALYLTTVTWGHFDELRKLEFEL